MEEDIKASWVKWWSLVKHLRTFASRLPNAMVEAVFFVKTGFVRVKASRKGARLRKTDHCGSFKAF
jgi:hypothetical protein